ncbi:MAG: tRNA pseudouridine(55) synthase TruB [Dehalococcoidia bacterium]
MDGIFNINKPRGKTSFRIVARIRRLSGEKHVGHAGTLDPDATGVLPVGLGKGTRVIEYLMDNTKAYRARIEFGTATDTYDSSGKITQRGDISGINRKAVESALGKFRGDIEQIPPMYSAIKHRGQPLYKLAREGISIARKKRKVTIHKLKLVYWRKPVATVDIECSKGTYVRSLAHDLGEYLGCGAHLRNLVRNRSGIFSINDAISMQQLERAFRQGSWRQYILPVDSVLRDFPSVTVDDDSEKDIKNGKRIMLESVEKQSKYCRAYSGDGRFLAILRRTPEKSVWQPKKVFI